MKKQSVLLAAGLTGLLVFAGFVVIRKFFSDNDFDPWEDDYYRSFHPLLNNDEDHGIEYL